MDGVWKVSLRSAATMSNVPPADTPTAPTVPCRSGSSKALGMFPDWLSAHGREYVLEAGLAICGLEVRQGLDPWGCVSTATAFLFALILPQQWHTFHSSR